MEAKLQRRLQRYGWDLAATEYEALWQAQLASAHAELLASASLAPGERILDVACGTGLIAFTAAREVGRAGRVLGVDLSGRMVEVARRQADEATVSNVRFERMDAEALELADGCFDVALCALGLMYMPDPERALREMRRVLRPGGRAIVSVWGTRALCGWAALFPIVDAEVASDVCPLFFRLGERDALAAAFEHAALEDVRERRIAASLSYGDAEQACGAAFIAGPVALAWARFDDNTRARVRRRYLDAIAAWRDDRGYRVPAEFVIVSGRVPVDAAAGR